MLSCGKHNCLEQNSSLTDGKIDRRSINMNELKEVMKKVSGIIYTDENLSPFSKEEIIQQLKDIVDDYNKSPNHSTYISYVPIEKL
jgi:hypothetical protein